MSAIRALTALTTAALAILCFVPSTGLADTRDWSDTHLAGHGHPSTLDGSSCALGMLGAGSPLTLTRLSDFFPAGTARPGDRLLAIGDEPIADEADLRRVLHAFRPGDNVKLVVARQREVLEFHAPCRDPADVLDARREAVTAAAEKRWADCVKATYFEELLWGGASSESAGLRLWCHEAGLPDRLVSTRLHAQFVFEFAMLRLEEMQLVPGGLNRLRSELDDSIAQLRSAGFTELARTISHRLSSTAI